MDINNDSNQLEMFNLEYIDFIKEKITALALYENILIIGDEHGVLKLYSMTMKSNQCFIEKRKEESIGKSKIDKIICIDDLKVTLVLSNQTIYIFTLPELANRSSKEKIDPIMKMAINTHKDHKYEIAVITKKKKVKVFRYQPDVFRLIETNICKEKEISLSDIPDTICVYENWLFCNNPSKKKYYIINLSNGQKQSQDLVSQSIIHVKDSFLLFTEGIGLFMDGFNPSSKTPITFSSKKFVSFCEYKNYIFALHEGEIGVYDSDNPVPQQTLALESSDYTAKYILSNNTNILVLTMKQIDKKTYDFKAWKIQELPIQLQITKSVQDHRYDEALNIINKNYNAIDTEKVNVLSNYYLICGWSCLREFNKDGYENAKKYFHISDVNVFEVIYMYYTILNIVPVHDEMKNITPDSLKQTQIEYLDPEKDFYTNALNFLVDFLSDKRAYYMSKAEASSSKVQIISFDNSPNSLSLLTKASKEANYSLMETLKLMNLTMAKAIAKLGKMKKFGELIDSLDTLETDHLKTFLDELESDSFLNKINSKDSKMALAYIYEKQGKFKEALDIWKDFGKDQNNEAKYRNPARDRSFKILWKFGNDKKYEDLFKANIRWLFHLDKEQSYSLFLENELLSIDVVLYEILQQLENEKGVIDRSYSQHFFEYINNSNKRCEKYQTSYIVLLIEQLFKKHPIEKMEPPEEKGLKNDYDKLVSIIKENDLYNKNGILQKIKGKWMLDIELYLLSELNDYHQALQRLLEIGKKENNFTKARIFCVQNIDKKINLFTELFKLLHTEFSLTGHKIYEDEMLEILKQFIDDTLLDNKVQLLKSKKFEILNPNEIINLLPHHWKINDKVLSSYLELVLKESAFMNNKFKLQKNLLKIDLVYNKIELGKMKNKCVEILNDTKCCFCDKKIANNIFVVYPNNNIYHAKCAGNPSVDPITNVDFSNRLINLNNN